MGPLSGVRETKVVSLYNFDNIWEGDDKWWSIIKQDVMMLDMRRMEVLTYLGYFDHPPS
jgi:hypothetical protein